MNRQGRLKATARVLAIHVALSAIVALAVALAVFFLLISLPLSRTCRGYCNYSDRFDMRSIINNHLI